MLSGKKRVFQNHEVVQVKAPRFREMTVARVFGMVQDVPSILNYLPSEGDGTLLPREYFFNVSDNYSTLIMYVFSDRKHSGSKLLCKGNSGR